jgi:sulfate-transporting ATPase
MLIVTLISYPDGIASHVAHLRAARRDANVPAGDATGATEREVAEPESAISHPRVTPRRLVVDDISVRFGAVHAVDGVSLTVEPGEVVGLMGPNGAGKTTLIDAVTGFVPIHHGSVSVDGRRVDRMNARRRAHLGVSRSFQSLELFEEISVLENIRTAVDALQPGAYFRDLVWPRETELTDTANAAIRMLGLGDDLSKKPNELSFGKRRLVAIARAIASAPSVLLLDEPAAGLDERESAELGTLIRLLAEQWGFGVLLVEHDVPMLMRTCDRVVAIDFGREIATGTPEQIRNDPQVIASYLGEELPTDADPAVEGAGR